MGLLDFDWKSFCGFLSVIFILQEFMSEEVRDWIWVAFNALNVKIENT